MSAIRSGRSATAALSKTVHSSHRLDQVGAGVIAFQSDVESGSGGEDDVRRAREVSFHAVDNLGLYESFVRAVPVHTVVYDTAVGDAVEDISTGRGVDPEHSRVYSFGPAHRTDKPGYLSLIHAVNEAKTVVKGQDRRQRIDCYILRNFLPSFAVGFRRMSRRLILETRDRCHGRIKIQDTGIFQSRHHLLFPRRERVPR